MFRNSPGHKLSSFRLCFRIELGNLVTRWGAQQFHWSAQKTSKTLSRKYNAFLYQPVQSRHTINKCVQRECTCNVCTLNTVESKGRTTTLCLRTERQQQRRPTAKRSLDLNIINEVIAAVNRARCVWFFGPPRSALGFSGHASTCSRDCTNGRTNCLFIACPICHSLASVVRGIWLIASCLTTAISFRCARP